MKLADLLPAHALNTWRPILEAGLSDSCSGMGHLVLHYMPSVVGNQIVTTHINIKFGGDKGNVLHIA